MRRRFSVVFTTNTFRVARHMTIICFSGQYDDLKTFNLMCCVRPTELFKNVFRYLPYKPMGELCSHTHFPNRKPMTAEYETEVGGTKWLLIVLASAVS